MSIPTDQEIIAEYRRQFPGAGLGEHERAFLAIIVLARSHGVGYGWMRQAIGLAWKLDDPVGYIDDDRIVELHTGHGV